jgi:hypothetical protein
MLMNTQRVVNKYLIAGRLLIYSGGLYGIYTNAAAQLPPGNTVLNSILG